ncbi:hypothetical protein QDY70_11690, partial [Kingella negevensis]|nr:hypothetical protein [Kingella negevensis]
YKLAEQYADIVASRLKISREEALGRIIRHMQRTVDYATAKADNFHTDDAIISILGANNLPKQDQYYTNPNYNKQYIQNYVRDFNLANKYNYFGKTPTQSRDYKVGVVVDIGKAALNSGINAVESTVNLATGEIDPNSWAYVHMGRIGYTHPEYGNALENTMTLGVAAVTAGRAGTQVRVRNIQQTKLVEELTANGIKFNPNNVVAITKTTDGKIVWLETGNSRAGLNHIIERHRQEFLKKGISESEIPNYLMTAVKNGQIVGMQRTRPIYEFTYNGTKHRVAIDIGNNGFIVGANPKGVVK